VFYRIGVVIKITF